MSIKSLKQYYTQVNQTKQNGFSQTKFKQTFEQSIKGQSGFLDSFASTQWTSSSLKDTDVLQLFLSFLSYGLRPETQHYKSFLKYAVSEKGRGKSSIFNTIKSGNGAKLKNDLVKNNFRNLFFEVFPENVQLFNQFCIRVSKIKPLDKKDAENVTALVDSIVSGTNIRAENE